MPNASRRQRIVLGVDHSLAGYAALRMAVAIARANRAPLYAVRAMPGIGTVPEDYVPAAFREAAGALPRDLDLHIETVGDSVCGALLRFASHPGDMIVVGNSGKGALRAFWCGSVGRSLFKKARCPVLVVSEPEMARATRRSARGLRRSKGNAVWARLKAQPPAARRRPYQGT